MSLKKNYDEGKLSPFYILRGSLSRLKEYLFNELAIPKNSSDLLIFDQASYKIADFDHLFYLLNFPPHYLKYRLIIIEHAHHLSEIILNKFLKSLESGGRWSIFFLVENNRHFLATIESRAIHIRLTEYTPQFEPFIAQKKELLSMIAKQNIAPEIIDAILTQDLGQLRLLLRDKHHQLQIIDLLLHIEFIYPSSYADKKIFLEEMKKILKLLTYSNHSSTELLMPFIWHQLTRFMNKEIAIQ